MSKPRLTASAAALLVQDVQAAATYYRDKLGFRSDGFFGEPPSFCILYRDSCYLMLKQVAESKHVVPHWQVSDQLCNVYFWVKNADELYREFQERGATICYVPEDQPYGCREFGIRDLDNYGINFGQVIRPPIQARPTDKMTTENANLPGAEFINTNLSGGQFRNVNLGGALFEDVALTGAVIRNANCSGVTIDNARLEGMTINGISVTELLRVYRGKE